MDPLTTIITEMAAVAIGAVVALLTARQLGSPATLGVVLTAAVLLPALLWFLSRRVAERSLAWGGWAFASVFTFVLHNEYWRVHLSGVAVGGRAVIVASGLAWPALATILFLWARRRTRRVEESGARPPTSIAGARASLGLLLAATGALLLTLMLTVDTGPLQAALAVAIFLVYQVGRISIGWNVVARSAPVELAEGPYQIARQARELTGWDVPILIANDDGSDTCLTVPYPTPWRPTILVGLRFLADRSADDFKTILCHEIGHVALRHVARRSVASVLSLLVMASGWIALNVTVGPTTTGIFGPVTLFAGLGLRHLWLGAYSLRLEYAADEFAAAVVGAQAVSHALATLAQQLAGRHGVAQLTMRLRRLEQGHADLA